MATTDNDSMISLRNEGAVVVAAFNSGSFHEEKQILATLERLGGVIDSRENVKMVLDLAKVESLSSAGLGRLVALLKKAVRGGGTLCLASLRDEIRELFDVMRLTQIFKLFPTTEDAVTALQSSD